MTYKSAFLDNSQVARENILKALEAFLLQQKKLGSIHPLATDFIEMLLEYSGRGKTVRGVLVARGYEWFGGTDLQQTSYQVAAAVELLNDALLIHDDIIDQDDIRRGKPSMHRLLEQYAQERNWSNPTHTGKSLAIVVGDLCYFWLQQLITELDCDSDIKLKLLNTLARESVHTGVGEAVDVISSVEPLTEVSTKEIEVVNLYKTARYTVSLPLLLAGHLAKLSQSALDDVSEFGDLIGSVFQLKDDELGLFGSAEEIGKPVGSDIREGKRTVWWCELLDRVSEQDKDTLISLSGKKDITTQEIEWVRELVISSGTDAVIKEKIATLKQQALELMEKLPVTEAHRPELEEAVAYIIDRRK